MKGLAAAWIALIFLFVIQSSSADAAEQPSSGESSGKDGKDAKEAGSPWTGTTNNKGTLPENPKTCDPLTSNCTESQKNPDSSKGHSHSDDAESKYAELHMHPHPPAVKYPSLNTVIRSTYGDDDEFGPKNWDKVPSARFTTNDCQNNMFTPLNIISSKAGMRVSRSENEVGHGTSSLTFFALKDIESLKWEFGFPEDTFNGLAVIPTMLGSLQLVDDFDSHEMEEGRASRMYDFSHALITFCDFKKSSPKRSGHQIDGKRFPLEIHLIFSANSLELGIDRTVFSDRKNDIVMVSILGEISEEDSPDLRPIIEAAKEFSGTDYTVMRDLVVISKPFSPLRLIPHEDSGYFYYKGNFPIPPCYGIPRIYVMKKPIPISQKQLSVLTNIKSAREPSGTLSCTFGLLQGQMDENEVLHNPAGVKGVRHLDSPQSGSNPTSDPYFLFQIFYLTLIILHNCT